MSLKVIEQLIPIRHPNRSGQKLTELKARIWHGTANFNPSATDTMNVKYASRPFIKKWDDHDMKYKFYEADGKTLFMYGAGNVYIDANSCTICIPLDEVAPHAGDRQANQYNNGFKGQTRLAKELFDNKQNSLSVGIELCMNDMSKWEQVLENAIEFTKLYISGLHLLDLRHYDLTRKPCPSPFVNLKIEPVDPRWVDFKLRLRNELD